MPIDFAKGLAVSIASRKLKKVAGNLPGLLGLNKGNINNLGFIENLLNLFGVIVMHY